MLVEEGKEGEKLGASRALETQEGMGSEEAGASESSGGLIKPQVVGPPPGLLIQ